MSEAISGQRWLWYGMFLGSQIPYPKSRDFWDWDFFRVGSQNSEKFQSIPGTRLSISIFLDLNPKNSRFNIWIQYWKPPLFRTKNDQVIYSRFPLGTFSRLENSVTSGENVTSWIVIRGSGDSIFNDKALSRIFKKNLGKHLIAPKLDNPQSC